MNDLDHLKKQIEDIRNQLHAAFQGKCKFSDPEVHRLSVQLDRVLFEYQSCLQSSFMRQFRCEVINPVLWRDIELFPLYQQIVRLTEPSTEFAYEATIRGKTPSGKHIPPSVLFRQAGQEQMLLDYIARHIAIREAVPLIKDSSLLFLNCHVLSLQAGFIFEDVSKLEVPITQLVLEITEQTRIKNVAVLKRELDTLRKQGLKIALDDFGAGFSNFGLVEAFQPDYIKLDRSIISSLDHSDQSRRVMEGMVAFAEKVKTILIAEGIEREEQRNILVELGVTYGQGFFLGYPFILTKKRHHQRKRDS
ncbi:EAL domain-containing protein [Effusibacillus dendaii]|nr:EAL domain-containing protein [Effusibacillus dendaii]